jgi:hypothetical protein
VPRDHDLRQETDEPAAHEILDRFVDAGGTFIDTADVYSAGVSEEIIGRWLKRRGRHDDLVIATKARFPVGDGAPSGLSRRYLRRAVEANLRRLGVERIDLHQAHCWDPNTPIEETLDTYEDLVREGKIDYVGVSNFAGWHLQRTMLLGRERPRALRSPSSRSTACSSAGWSGRSGPSARRRTSGSCPGRRSAAAGWRASTAAASAPRAPRAWARTPPAARRRGTGAARSRPGRCSTWSGRSPRPAADDEPGRDQLGQPPPERRRGDPRGPHRRAARGQPRRRGLGARAGRAGAPRGGQPPAAAGVPYGFIAEEARASPQPGDVVQIPAHMAGSAARSPGARSRRCGPRAAALTRRRSPGGSSSPRPRP